MKLGELIKEYRNQNNVTMQDFANKSGLSKGYISMLEKNRHPQSMRELIPSIATYNKVASALNISLDELISQIDGEQRIGLMYSDINEGVDYSNNYKNDFLTPAEKDFLEKCRTLDQSGRDTVFAALENQYARCNLKEVTNEYLNKSVEEIEKNELNKNFA